MLFIKYQDVIFIHRYAASIVLHREQQLARSIFAPFSLFFQHPYVLLYSASSDEMAGSVRDLLATSALEDAESAAYWAYHLGRTGFFLGSVSREWF